MVAREFDHFMDNTDLCGNKIVIHFYAIHDYDPELKKKGAVKAKKSELRRYNNDGWGIYISPNQGKASSRKADDISDTDIAYWYIDIDGIPDDFDKMAKMIEVTSSSLTPQMVVKTKNGIHCYWRAIDATKSNFKEIEQRLIHKFGGDKACKDVSRILRVPGYLHKKDPNDPYVINTVWKVTGVGFKERTMLDLLDPIVKEPVTEATDPKHKGVGNYENKHYPCTIPNENFQDFIQKLESCDQKDIMLRLSGDSIVNGEQYTFPEQITDGWKLYINGKRSRFWVDSEGFLGADAGYGKNVYNWLSWYEQDKKERIEIIKQILGGM